jgi:hypothetical protein
MYIFVYHFTFDCFSLIIIEVFADFNVFDVFDIFEEFEVFEATNFSI